MAVSDGYPDDGETSIGYPMEMESAKAVANPDRNKNAPALEDGEIQSDCYIGIVCNPVKVSLDFQAHESVARSDDEMVPYDDLQATRLEEILIEDVPLVVQLLRAISEDDCDQAYTNEIWLFGSSLQDDDDSIALCGQEVYCTPPEALGKCQEFYVYCKLLENQFHFPMNEIVPWGCGFW